MNLYKMQQDIKKKVSLIKTLYQILIVSAEIQIYDIGIEHKVVSCHLYCRYLRLNKNTWRQSEDAKPESGNLSFNSEHVSVTDFAYSM